MQSASPQENNARRMMSRLITTSLHIARINEKVYSNLHYRMLKLKKIVNVAVCTSITGTENGTQLFAPLQTECVTFR